MLVDSTQNLQMANVTGAIQKAAKLTGTSFQYLLATAKVESNLDPDAAAKTSSAGGLFQFIEQTWLQTLKEAGPALGYGQYAAAISEDEQGRFSVADPKLRAQIMNLRRDPTANAVMAGAFTQSNAAFLKERLGRKPTDGELYIAHFLGANGAARLIGQAAETPNASAAELFPNAARANRSIFFDKGGKARNFAEVANVLSGKFDVAQAAPVPAVTVPVARVLPAETARVARAYDAASPIALAQRAALAAGEPTYSNPYRTAERRAPVAAVPAANDMWTQAAVNAARGRQMAGTPRSAPVQPVATVQPATPALSDTDVAQKLATAAMPRPPERVDVLSLFQDSKPNYRGLFTRS